VGLYFISVEALLEQGSISTQRAKYYNSFYGLSVTNKLTSLFTIGPIKIIDKKTRGHPSMKLDGHFSKNTLADGVLINVITPLTIRAVLNDIKNAKTNTR
jgi:hypothetical protein